MKKFFTAISIFFSILLLNASVASAKVVIEEKGAVVIKKDEIVNDDLFIGAESVDIEGTVNGDVYAGAESVRVSGTVNGDLHVGAGVFYLSGKVRDDVYVGAGSVSVSGAVIGDSLLIGSGNVNIDSSSSIGGSLLAGAGNINIYAPVARNIMIGAGTVDLNSKVGGEVRLGAGEISVGPDTKIAKDLYYTVGEEGREIKMSEGATVSGKIQKIENKFTDRAEIEKAKTGFSGAFKAFSLIGTIISFLGALIVGYLGLRFFPKTFTESSKLVSTSFLKSLGVGFLVTIVIVPILIVLAITGVGLPLAGILFLIFLINFYLAKIVVSVSLGEWITKKFNWKFKSAYGVFAVGLLAFYILKMIPIFGFLISLVVLWIGLGALTIHYIVMLKQNVIK